MRMKFDCEGYTAANGKVRIVIRDKARGPCAPSLGTLDEEEARELIARLQHAIDEATNQETEH